METDRAKSGIPGLDKLLKCGYPEGSIILVTGNAGTGKTTFVSQFIWNSLQDGERCLFITLEETPEDIRKDALQFGWNFAEYEKKGNLRIVFYDPFEIDELKNRLTDQIVVNKYSRLVIDSTSIFEMYVKDKYESRKKLYELVQQIKKAGITALLTAEIPEDSHLLSREGIEEFVVDGVIVLSYDAMGGKGFGNLEVRKMRGTSHEHGAFPTKIGSKGLSVDSEGAAMFK